MALVGFAKEDLPYLEAIIAAPDDDGPRLVWADALTERGDPRGEFITLQCARAAGRGGARAGALRKREEALLTENRGYWFGALEAFLKERDSYFRLSHVAIERGFVTACRLRATERTDLAGLFARAPLLERLGLSGAEVEVFPELSRLRELELGGDLSPGFRDALTAGAWPGLVSLTLHSARGAAQLDLSRLPRLERLELGVAWALRALRLADGVPLTHLAWERDLHPPALLAGLTQATQLSTVSVKAQRFSVAHVQALSTRAPSLRRLVMEASWFDPGALAAFAATPWPVLERLDLHSSVLHAEGAGHLTALDAPKLTHLDVSNCQLKNEGVATLLGSKLVPQLRELNLRANRLTLAGLEPLLHRPHALTLLNLKKNPLTPEDLAGLAERWPDTKLSR